MSPNRTKRLGLLEQDEASGIARTGRSVWDCSNRTKRLGLLEQDEASGIARTGRSVWDCSNRTKRLGLLEQDEASGIARFSSDSYEHSITQRTVVVPVRYTNTKLPAFTGKESWTVCYNHFQEVANRRGWNDEQCLDELIPKLQGNAGEFVFNQLSSCVRRNDRSLVNELNSRFRAMETPELSRCSSVTVSRKLENRWKVM